MNELTSTNGGARATAKRGEDGGIVVADPFREGEYHADAQSLIKSVHGKQYELRAAFEALGELDAAPTEAVKEMATALTDADKRLLAYTGDIADALLDMSGFRAVVTQIKGAKARIDPMSVRGRIAEMLKACKARLDAEKPPKPRHMYVLVMECDDDGLMATMKTAKKNGADGVTYAVPQSDKAVKQITAWLEDNVR